MRGVTLCDVCGKTMNYRKYKIKARYQYSNAYFPKRLDVCDDCWEEMSRLPILSQLGFISR